MSSYVIFMAALIVALLIGGCASAFMETSQYHPDANIMQYWGNVSDAYGSEQWSILTGYNAAGTCDVYITPYSDTYTNVTLMYARAKSSGTAGGNYAITILENAENLKTDYFSFYLAGATYSSSSTGSGHSGDFYLNVSNQQGSSVLILLWSDSGNPKNSKIPNPGLYEVQLIANEVYLIINGTSQGSQGTFVSGGYISNTQFRLRAYTGGSSSPGGASTTLLLYIDDISLSHAVGIGADRSPSSDYTHYMTRTEIDPDDQPAYEVDASYTIKTQPATAYTAAKYEMKVRRLTDGVITNTTTLKEAGVVASNDSPGFGTLIHNRTDIFGENFTTYQFYTTKDGEMQAHDVVSWFYYSLTGSSWVDIADTISSDIETDIDYSIDTPDYTTYNYYIKVISADAVLKETFSITTDTGTEILDTSGYDAGIYYVVLQAVDKSTSAMYDLALDMTTVSDIVIIAGTTYNAQSNAALTTANVNDSQLSEWYNTTSDGTGDYELQGFTEDAVIDINATKTNYTHQDFTFTPLQVGMYTMDLYLFPSNITRSTTAIEGVVISYPLHQGIPNATVNIWNDTWSSNTTATPCGYYIFDNLTCDTSNVLNETFNSSEFDTWVSLNYSNINYGSELVSNTTDETPFVNGTDYSINHTDGTIKVLSTGNMVNYTDYHIDYDYYVETTYHVNATKSLYTDSNDYDVVVTYNNWTIQNVLLHPIYTLTVKAKDHDSHAFISSFTATIGDNAIETTNGTAIFYLDYGLYTITITSSGYYPGTDSLLLNQNKTSTTTLTKTESQYYAPHYVRFKLVSVFGSVYPNVAVAVYEGAAASGDQNLTGTTGSDGSVTFKMTQDVQYTLTFANTSRGIDKTITLYPMDTMYYIIIGTGGKWTEYEDRPMDSIHITVKKSTINDTHAYINVTYRDDTNGTLQLMAWINQTNPHDPRNATGIDSHTFAGNLNDTNHSFIVSPYKGQSYQVRIWHEHNQFGTFYDRSIRFAGMLIDLGLPSAFYFWFSIGTLFFLAAFFGATTTSVGSIIVCAFGWVFLAIGWLAALGIFGPISLTLASVYAVANNLITRHHRGGFA